jgi:phosphatidylserine decarboxylase
MIRLAQGAWGHIAVAGGVPLAAAGIAAGAGRPVLAWVLGILGAAGAGFMVFFFRDPDRAVQVPPEVILSGADGWVRSIERLDPTPHFPGPAVRISTFLTPFDVHVNRAPVQGRVTALAYTPGRHLLTVDNAASERNEHSTILIEGGVVACQVRQIVGPVVRRVVHWLAEGQGLERGERIGLMKFGSRLDVCLPADRVEVLVRRGERVRAGLTPIARVTRREAV